MHRTRKLGWIAGCLFVLAVLMTAGAYFISAVPPIVFQLGWGILLIAILLFVLWVFFKKVALGCATLAVLLVVCIVVLGINSYPVLQKTYDVHKPQTVGQDDRIQDKNPPNVKWFDEVRLDKRQGVTVYINKSASVIGLDMSDVKPDDKPVYERLYSNFREAKEAAGSMDCDFLPSVDLVDAYGRFFDDRLMAGVDEYLHRGSDIYPGGKQGFLKSVLAEVLKLPADRARNSAAAYLSTAIQLGGDEPAYTSDESRRLMGEFIQDKMSSKPTGIYTNSKVLAAIFQRDRFLQQPCNIQDKLGLLPMARMAESLLRKPELMIAYHRFRVLEERMCNPASILNVEDIAPFRTAFNDRDKLSESVEQSAVYKKAISLRRSSPGVAFWPFLSSREGKLFSQLDDSGFESRDSMDILVDAIKSEKVKLDPTPDSGWYDYQEYALETLLLPGKSDEASKLLLHQKYKKRLRDAFEAMLTKKRDSHVKMVEIVRSVGIHRLPLSQYPELSLEPCATCYLRTARAYGFLADSLKSSLGTDASQIRMKDFTGDLRSELDRTTALYYGLYLHTCNDIGMVPKLKAKEIAGLPWHQEMGGSNSDCAVLHDPSLSVAEKHARLNAWKLADDWLHNIDREKFLDEDVRVMVPVMSDSSRKRYQNWATLGTQLQKIRTYYAKPPKISDRMFRTDWQTKEYIIPVQVFSEVVTGRTPMTREEFRTVCDRGKTKEGILRELGVRSTAQKTLPIILACILILTLIGLPTLRRILRRKHRV